MPSTDSEPLTFSELDLLCDLDPLSLTVENLDRLIAGMRAYRANALSKGKATRFSDEAGISIDVKAMGTKLGEMLGKAKAEPIKRRI